MCVPVLIITHARPLLFEQVFEKVLEYTSNDIIVYCDGPRHEEHIQVQKQTIKLVKEKIALGCKIQFLQQSKNLGCKNAVIDAISHFFKQYEKGIILEDDCLPSDAFFKFCEHGLSKYHNDHRIMALCGTNAAADEMLNEESYFFSSIALPWGWASWRRAWEKYDVSMLAWTEENKNHILYSMSATGWLERRYWTRLFDYYKFDLKNRDVWDYQWILSCISQSGLSIIPSENLISNIGFDDQATHTKNPKDTLSKLVISNTFKVTNEPTKILVNRTYDKKIHRIWFKIGLVNYLKYLVKKFLKMTK